MTTKKKGVRKVKKTKKHHHQWEYEFQDCDFCGGGETRRCKKCDVYQDKNGRDL